MKAWLDRHREHIIVFLLSVIVNGVLVLLLIRPAPASLHIVVPSPAAAPARLRVSVAGAVSAPDVYTLPVGSLVKDALAAAGGARPDADLSRLNLAREVRDQEQVWVPTTAGPGTTAAPESGSDIDRLNLNRATAVELESLPGIGPELARRIVDYRTGHGPFRTAEDLSRVPGIGPAILERIQGSVAVE